MKPPEPLKHLALHKTTRMKITHMKKITLTLGVLFVSGAMYAQNIKNNPGSNHGNSFEQLGTILPTPNEYRTASGAPGPKYWQQRCDYDITCELDEPNRRLTGKETLTYYNNSPDVLTYLWLQLDENQHSKKNNSGFQTSNYLPRTLSDADIKRMSDTEDKFGHNIL